MQSCGFNRRALLRSSSLIALSGVLPLSAARAGAPQLLPLVEPRQNRAPLAPQPFLFLPTGAIRPAGWLRRQLQIQARGMGGRLDEFWADVGPDSGWLGGKGESWERGPYFLDGLLPLAWALDDAGLKAKAQRFIDWTLESAQPSGMFGPKSNDDWWPRMVMLKVLTQYHELTGDGRVIPLMTGYFHHQLAALPARPLRDWGRFRWQDEMVALLWLYNQTGDAKLIDLARLLQKQGWDWRAMYADFPFKAKVTPSDIRLDEKASGDLQGSIKDLALSAHGVNNAMGIKASPVWSLVSGDAGDRDAVHRQLAELDRYHGMPMGIFSADEHFAGTSPSQGVELCAVVEAMFSLEHALAITGDTALGDRIERIAYNALPGTFTDDMWAHQYDQQPNQIRTGIQKGPWTTNGDQSNMFGLEPHFGCCTANFHQGWPKLLTSLWMGTAEGGLAAMVYAPSQVSTRVGGVAVTIDTVTDYPFRDTVAMTVSPARPTRFPLRLRVPAWSKGVEITINGKRVAAPVDQGFAMIARSWHKGDRVAIAFANATRTVAGYAGSVHVEHGPLLYALPIGERWTKLKQRGLSADWKAEPTSPWNYGIPADAAFRRVERPVPAVPFSRAAPGAAITVNAVRVPAWQAEGAYAAPPPQSPVALPGAKPEVITLIPYGAAKLRITSFPTVRA